MGIVTAILILLAGCGVFIAGMNMLGDGLEKSAGGGMKKLLGKISGNRFSGVGIGSAGKWRYFRAYIKTISKT